MSAPGAAPGPPLVFPTDTKLVSSLKDEVVLRFAGKTKEDFQVWMKEFQASNKLTYRIMRTQSRKKVLYKAHYRCHRNTLPKRHGTVKPHPKHTGCPALMLVTIKGIAKRPRSKDEYLLKYPTRIVLKNQHNHSIDAIESVKHRDPSEDVRKKFVELFKAGFGTTRALELHRRHLMEEYENYAEIAQDRFFCPDMYWVNRLHGLTAEEFGAYSADEMMATLRRNVSEMEEKGVQIVLREAGEHFTIAICTPLMQRVHSLLTSGEIAFLDSSRTVDPYNCHVFLIMVDSCVGGLPVGVLITSTEEEDMLTNALEDYVSLLSEESFGGRGKIGPAVFLTDDCESERNALAHCFPQSNVLLCTFHFLQETWKWLRDVSHGVEHECHYLYSCVSSLVQAGTTEVFEELQKDLLLLALEKSPPFYAFLLANFEKANEWAIWFAHNVSTRGKHMKSVTEAAIRAFEDKIMLRNKAYTVPQLVCFMVGDVTAYYEEKLTAAGAGKLHQFHLSQYKSETQTLQDLFVEKLSNSLFSVTSGDDKTCVVNVDLGTCSCCMGQNGATCKHQHVVAVMTCTCNDRTPRSSTARKELFFVASGKNELPDDWVDSLLCNDISSMQANSGSSDSPDNPTGQVSCKREAVNVLQRIMNDIATRYEKDPVAFNDAVSVFAKKYSNLQKDCDLLLALHTFGDSNAQSSSSASARSDLLQVMPQASITEGNSEAIMIISVPQTTSNMQVNADNLSANGGQTSPQPGKQKARALPIGKNTSKLNSQNELDNEQEGTLHSTSELSTELGKEELITPSSHKLGVMPVPLPPTQPAACGSKYVKILPRPEKPVVGYLIRKVTLPQTK